MIDLFWLLILFAFVCFTILTIFGTCTLRAIKKETSTFYEFRRALKRVERKLKFPNKCPPFVVEMNGLGEVRYWPQLPDGRMLYSDGWYYPEDNIGSWKRYFNTPEGSIQEVVDKLQADQLERDKVFREIK